MEEMGALMGCNAWNHPPGCRCGWGGDGHKGKSPGGWRGGGYSHGGKAPTLSAYSDTETQNRATTCPKCGSDVFFIRHNGGSVWLDPPLSPPWYKHPCFDENAVRRDRGTRFVNNAGSAYQDESVELVVVDSCVFSNESLKSELRARFSDGNFYSLSVAGDARKFVGEICFFDCAKGEVWPFDGINFKMSCKGGRVRVSQEDYISSRESFDSDVVKNDGHSTSRRKYWCKICHASFGVEDSLSNHLKAVHNVLGVSFSGEVTGYLLSEDSEVEKNQVALKKGVKSEVRNRSASGVSGKSNKRDSHGRFDLEAKALKDRFHSSSSYRKEYLKLLVLSALDACKKDDGWSPLGEVGMWVYESDPLFKPKNYGFKKLASLMESLSYVEMKVLVGDNGSKLYFAKKKAA